MQVTYYTQVWLLLEWRTERSKKSPSTSFCPHDLLNCPQPNSINFWLSHFVNKARKQYGVLYPPRTLRQILAGLQRYMIEMSPSSPKFLDQSNPVYRDLLCVDTPRTILLTNLVNETRKPEVDRVWLWTIQ